MKKYLWLAALGIVVVLVFILLKGKGASPEGIILYYGDTCPHCEVVDAFIRENKMHEKIVFTEKEVFQDKKNAYELGKKATLCGLSTDQIVVPLLWTGTGCLIGEQDIEQFLTVRSLPRL
ncbi:MAG: hypothetical protein PHI23_04755 [Candidatus Peribacteraceae bacterium]|nr:hypothetical protein [Candidatus Peribacteraceae bacterium]